MSWLALTVFLGAFLLFQVQPLIGKFILPWYGGIPAVWTTCLLFFQALLLGGYAYAHCSARYFKPRLQAVVHLALLGAALALLPITPSPEWKPVSLENPTWHILKLLLVCLGLPYFVLSATGPLLQDWFRRLHPGTSPYRLFALSNFGSLLALITYPFGIEPAFPRQTQAALWSWALGLFAVICGVCAVRLWISNPTSHSLAQENDELPEGTQASSPAVKLLWLSLSACASVLLLAFTNKMCQEVSVIPFLWVLPLSLYLLSFIICFESPRLYSRPVFSAAFILGLFLMCGQLFAGLSIPMLMQIGIHSGTLFVCCMICHGELYRLKPRARSLTSYYLMIAAGGALGGGLVAILAPLLFNFYLEVHWGLWICSLLWMLTYARDGTAFRWGKRSLPLWNGALLTVLLLGGVLLWNSRYATQNAIHLARNFYGILGVYELEKDKPEEHRVVLTSGRINHGLQFVSPSKASLPHSYYSEGSGVELALRHLNRPEGRRIGLVGLGTGTLAAYGQPGDYLRYYELNPEIKRVAEKYFGYLKNSPARVEIVMGDARLSLESEPSGQFDLLVLDAFTSDAIPVHLLTREAFAIYLRHLKPDGVIVVNITNRYLDLQPVLEKVAAHFQFGFGMVPFPGPRFAKGSLPVGIFASRWVLLARDKSFLEIEAIHQVAISPLANLDAFPLWTDEYTSLFELVN